MSHASDAPPVRGRLDDDQLAQLLRAIHKDRVFADRFGRPATSGQDIRAHLIRLFGFGGFDVQTVANSLLYLSERLVEGVPSGRWDCAYSATVRLVIYNRRGERVCVLEGSNVAHEEDMPRGRALRLALTSAETLALKRAAICLGDQFGLGLYNGGALAPIVVQTLEGLRAELTEAGKPEGAADVQAVVPEQVADEMEGADPDSPAELARWSAYMAARRTDEGPAEQAPALSAQQEREMWLAEVAVLEGLLPGIGARLCARLAPLEGAAPTLEEAPLAELGAVVAGVRQVALLQLRKRSAHEVADAYMRADPARPLQEALLERCRQVSGP